VCSTDFKIVPAGVFIDRNRCRHLDATYPRFLQYSTTPGRRPDGQAVVARHLKQRLRTPAPLYQEPPHKATVVLGNGLFSKPLHPQISPWFVGRLRAQLIHSVGASPKGLLGLISQGLEHGRTLGSSQFLYPSSRLGLKPGFELVASVNLDNSLSLSNHPR
jgi:hypothetical protein